MSGLEKLAVDRILQQAHDMGVPIPDEVQRVADTLDRAPVYPARKWATEHPDDTSSWDCCWGAVTRGPAGCLCWIPEYDLEQAQPQPLGIAPIGVAERMCGDCAYRKDSPERADGFMEETLMDLPTHGQVFFCHVGMRRPVRWRHPEYGHVVEGSPDDYQPPFVDGVPYRADGSPGELCAGFAAVARRDARRRATRNGDDGA